MEAGLTTGDGRAALLHEDLKTPSSARLYVQLLDGVRRALMLAWRVVQQIKAKLWSTPNMMERAGTEFRRIIEVYLNLQSLDSRAEGSRDLWKGAIELPRVSILQNAGHVRSCYRETKSKGMITKRPVTELSPQAESNRRLSHDLPGIDHELSGSEFRTLQGLGFPVFSQARWNRVCDVLGTKSGFAEDFPFNANELWQNREKEERENIQYGSRIVSTITQAWRGKIPIVNFTGGKSRRIQVWMRSGQPQGKEPLRRQRSDKEQTKERQRTPTQHPRNSGPWDFGDAGRAPFVFPLSALCPSFACAKVLYLPFCPDRIQVWMCRLLPPVFVIPIDSAWFERGPKIAGMCLTGFVCGKGDKKTRKKAALPEIISGTWAELESNERRTFVIHILPRPCHCVQASPSYCIAMDLEPVISEASDGGLRLSVCSFQAPTPENAETIGNRLIQLVCTIGTVYGVYLIDLQSFWRPWVDLGSIENIQVSTRLPKKKIRESQVLHPPGD
ncbi:hypothetical protein DFH06DRAFT_1139859 [Mycena polygramma]|nr:hypothetical protein DFH06DRAFT_1139859 [Mycena polygramma]